jgi:hypothetical protein
MQTPTLISLGIILLTVLVSLLADRKFAGVARLPMQWGLNGRPTWTAPRGFALAFIPALSMLIFAAQYGLQLLAGRPLPPNEMVVIAATFLVINIIYVGLLRRVLK